MKVVGKLMFVAACGGTAITGIAVSTKPKAHTILESVKGYRTWDKANPKPVRLSTILDGLCRGVMPEEHEFYEKQNPHFDRYLTVFVNDIGKDAMMKGGTFPVGSVIVKEKQHGTITEKPNGKPIMSTVMVKREKGYNPTCGDWEFAALDATGTKTNGEGKMDFVYRTYVGIKGDWNPSGYNPKGWKWRGR
jgi:hypothetical protein